MSEKDIITFEAGERIISEGEPAAAAYIILKGKVRVFLEKDGKSVALAELAITDMFGETALFDNGGTYGANVENLEPVELVVISPDEFKEKLEECDPMIRNMYGIMMERLRKTNEALVNSETREFMDIILV